MIRTILRPYPEKETKVEVETRQKLTETQKSEIEYAIRRAFTWTFEGSPPPSVETIKQATADYDSVLANDIISIKYC